MPFHQTLFDRISEGGNRLFGAPQGLLSPEEQSFAKQQGLLGLGSSLLRASGPSREPVGLGQAIGEAIPQGQAAAFQGLQQQDFLTQRRAAQQAAQARRQALQVAGRALQGGKPEGFDTAVQGLVQAGLVDEAKSLSEMAENLGDTVTIVADGQSHLVTKRSGRILRSFQKSDKGARPTQLVQQMGPSGVPEFVIYDPNDKSFTRTGQFAFSAPTEAERKAAFFIPQLALAAPVIDEFIGSPKRLESLLQAGGLRELTSTEIQTLDIAGRMFAESFLRMTSGAALNPGEIENASKMFRPMAGDTKETLELKRKFRLQVSKSMLSAAGRAAVNETGPLIDRDPTGDFESLLRFIDRADAVSAIDALGR